jgi:hypothetical protein
VSLTVNETVKNTIENDPQRQQGKKQFMQMMKSVRVITRWLGLLCYDVIFTKRLKIEQQPLQTNGRTKRG